MLYNNLYISKKNNMIKDFFSNFSNKSSLNLKNITSNFLEIEAFDIVLLNSQNTESNYKKSLSSFNDLSRYLKICDLGQAQSDYFGPLIDNIVEINSHHKTIFIEICKQHQLPLKNENQNLVFSSNPSIQNIGKATIAGSQRHYLNYENIDNNVIGLGQIREDISLLEPIIRNTTNLSFSTTCIKRAETLSHTSPACGLTILEACKIARYAGFSDSLSHLQIVLPSDTNEQLDEIVALFIWYFMEARTEFVRLNNKPDHMQKYIVHCDSLDVELSFIKDITKDKWWVVNPFEKDQKIPCNEADYMKILNGEDPVEFLSIFETIQS